MSRSIFASCFADSSVLEVSSVRWRLRAAGCKAATEALMPVSGTYAQPGPWGAVERATSLTPKLSMAITYSGIDGDSIECVVVVVGTKYDSWVPRRDKAEMWTMMQMEMGNCDFSPLLPRMQLKKLAPILMLVVITRPIVQWSSCQHSPPCSYPRHPSQPIFINRFLPQHHMFNSLSIPHFCLVLIFSSRV